jgi:rubrerythrin
MDDRNVRCGCGHAYNGYKWASCPVCKANELRCYSLACLSCGHTYFHSERVEPCPHCGSGETTIVVSPANRRVR